MTSAMDVLNEAGAPAFKFANVGDAIVGVVVGLKAQQDQDYEDPTILKWWNREDGPARGNPDDRPKMIVILTLQTELQDSEDDNGLRSVWCRGHLITELRKAIHSKLGIKAADEDVNGGKVRIVHSSLGQRKPKMNPPKLFTVEYRPPPAPSPGMAAANDAAEAEDGDPGPAAGGSVW